MNISSIQSYNPKSKVNSKQNKSTSFKGFSTVEQNEMLLKTSIDYRFILLTVNSRFKGNPDAQIARGDFTDSEQDGMRELFDFCRQKLVKTPLSPEGIYKKELLAGAYRRYIIESGPVSKVDGAASLLKYTGKPYDSNNCTALTIRCPDLELKNNFYTIIFDEKGFPDILAHLDQDGKIIHAFIPNKH